MMLVGVVRSRGKDHGDVEEEFLLQFVTCGGGWIQLQGSKEDLADSKYCKDVKDFHLQIPFQVDFNEQQKVDGEWMMSLIALRHPAT